MRTSRTLFSLALLCLFFAPNLTANGNDPVGSPLQWLQLPYGQDIVAENGQSAVLQFNIKPSERIHFRIRVNGEDRSSALKPANKLPIVGYDMQFASEQAFFISRWTVDGRLFYGAFESNSELLAALQAFDPRGDWQMDAQSQVIFAQGSPLGYGDMEIALKGVGNELLRLAPSAGEAYYGLSLQLPVGEHLVEVEHLPSQNQEKSVVKVSANQNKAR